MFTISSGRNTKGEVLEGRLRLENPKNTSGVYTLPVGGWVAHAGVGSMRMIIILKSNRLKSIG